MAIDNINLKTLLRYFGLPVDRRLAAVVSDARAEIRKRNRTKKGGGGDFHSCFWADAKNHAGGTLDLSEATQLRIEAKEDRARLYSLLEEGFLRWWNEKRRWINEEISTLPDVTAPPHEFVEIGGKVKIENCLAVRLGGDRRRLIYPYFSESPVLHESTARLGLWLMTQAFKGVDPAEFRILDVLRSESFSIERYPLTGNEGALFVERYAKMLSDWRATLERFG